MYLFIYLCIYLLAVTTTKTTKTAQLIIIIVMNSTTKQEEKQEEKRSFLIGHEERDYKIMTTPPVYKPGPISIARESCRYPGSRFVRNEYNTVYSSTYGTNNRDVGGFLIEEHDDNDQKMTHQQKQDRIMKILKEAKLKKKSKTRTRTSIKTKIKIKNKKKKRSNQNNNKRSIKIKIKIKKRS